VIASDSPGATTVVDGKALSSVLRSGLRDEVSRLLEQGSRAPRLAVVLVGDNPASASYIRGKRRACARIGMESLEEDLPAGASEAEILAVVERLNAAPEVDGILVQLPLPKGVDPNRIAAAIDPAKDVDGLHPTNAGRLLQGDPGLRPCTPLGILEILDRHEVELAGARCLVIGRSAIVGKPVALLLLERHATVTLAHSRTRDLPARVAESDVVVAAAGSPHLVKGSWIRPGSVVIDVGVNDLDGTLVGDVELEAALGRARIITPPRGGVGPMTITMLLRNTLQAYRQRIGA